MFDDEENTLGRFIRYGFLAASFLLLGVAGQVWPVDWGNCQRAGASVLKPDVTIPACSLIIDADKASQKDLAIAYYRRGRGYHKQGNLDSAIADYGRAIGLNPDLARAYSNRGFAYGGKGELDRAVASYKKAAALGDANGQATLGLLYARGEGVVRDFAAATMWLRRAAEKSHADAQLLLGLMHYDGKGVPLDYRQAMKWFQLAAGQGNAIAQFSLGLMYGKGEGVTQDYVQAHLWFNLAAEQGDTDAAEFCDSVAAKMTRDQITEAQRLAREWRPSAER